MHSNIRHALPRLSPYQHCTNIFRDNAKQKPFHLAGFYLGASTHGDECKTLPALIVQNILDYCNSTLVMVYHK